MDDMRHVYGRETLIIPGSLDDNLTFFFRQTLLLQRARARKRYIYRSTLAVFRAENVTLAPLTSGRDPLREGGI